MDKRKIDLDKLYQERFQSFEMEPSSAAASSMLKKLKWAKTMSVAKWIIGGILIATTAVTITLLSINTNEPETKNEKTEKQIITTEQITANNTTQERSESEIKTNELEPKKDKIAEEELNDELSQIDEVSEITSHQEPISEELIKQESESINNEKNASNASVEGASVVEPFETKESNLMEESNIYKLNSKYMYIEIPDIPVSFAKTDLKLNTPNRFLDSKEEKTTKNKTKAKSNSGSDIGNVFPLSGYIALQFAPILWQNNSDLLSPELDTSYSYAFNHSQKISYEFGWSFQLHHQKLPLFLQLGLDYQILKEEVDFQLSRTFEDPTLSYWTYDSSWAYPEVLDTFYIIINNDHFVIDSIFTTDTILSNVDSTYNPVNTTVEKSKNHLNTYRYINIPLLLGYQFESKNKKWSYQIMAGPSLSINLQNEGFYYTNNGDFEEYSGKVSPSLVWNFYAAANINYRWKKWQLFAQPEFQYQLKESELSNQIPRRKYQFYKMKFGIRYNLF